MANHHCGVATCLAPMVVFASVVLYLKLFDETQRINHGGWVARVFSLSKEKKKYLWG